MLGFVAGDLDSLIYIVDSHTNFPKSHHAMASHDKHSDDQVTINTALQKLHTKFIAKEMTEFAQDGHLVILSCTFKLVLDFPETRLPPPLPDQDKTRPQAILQFLAGSSSWLLNNHTLPLALNAIWWNASPHPACPASLKPCLWTSGPHKVGPQRLFSQAPFAPQACSGSLGTAAPLYSPPPTAAGSRAPGSDDLLDHFVTHLLLHAQGCLSR